MTTVADILREKRDTRIITMRMHETVATAALIMQRENISSVVVQDIVETEGATVIGVFSERDVARALVEYGPATPSLAVATFMRRALVSCALEDSVLLVLRRMTEHQIRHLPVMDDHALVGVLSATDLMRHYLHEAEAEACSALASSDLSAGLLALR
ncbi:CBS domain-containing protein [Aquabacter sp. L1I39]|uniref:CBS domain-containing protein n=1 Tax=Aquabacter sp. L1I39 TaxID=2820278 RepID=UPI001ADB7739|nr:CBS domain-containing protein [Aquabacter sp. L1I39]QTL03337.1 CBS domain-containing protein [Aquabacter sp. L1I39]